MKPSFSLLALLNLLGAGQGVLLSFALLAIKKGSKTNRRLLSAVTMTISIIVAGAVVVTTNYVFVYPHLSRLHQPFVFLGGPLLFLYVRTVITTKQRLTKRDALHFIPFAACLLYLIPYYFQGRSAKLAALYAEFYQQSFDGWYYVRSGLFLIQFFAYLIAIVVILLKYSREIRSSNSRHDPVTLFKVRFFVIGSIILWAGAMLRFIIDDTSKTNLVVPLGASILVYAMAYLEIAKSQEPEQASSANHPIPIKKYEKSRLTPERGQKYLKKLIDYMEIEKPYLKGNLTVQQLARALSIPAPHLSQIINEQLRESFPEFLNKYRVEEAKRRLLDPAFSHLSILGIAEDVGFNSKSSFNSVFKKYTNTTPSEFRQHPPQARKSQRR